MKGGKEWLVYIFEESIPAWDPSIADFTCPHPPITIAGCHNIGQRFVHKNLFSYGSMVFLYGTKLAVQKWMMTFLTAVWKHSSCLCPKRCRIGIRWFAMALNIRLNIQTKSLILSLPCNPHSSRYKLVLHYVWIQPQLNGTKGNGKERNSAPLECPVQLLIMLNLQHYSFIRLGLHYHFKSIGMAII